MDSSNTYKEKTFSVPRTCTVRRLLKDDRAEEDEDVEDAEVDEGACLSDSKDLANCEAARRIDATLWCSMGMVESTGRGPFEFAEAWSVGLGRCAIISEFEAFSTRTG